MNDNILNTVIQDFIKNNSETDTVSLLLKDLSFENVSLKEIVAQIEAKKRCKTKLATWYNTPNIYYPNKLNIEQTSSEVTAKYKSEIISGKSLIDLTGGFGVDSYHFAKVFKSVTHCEIDKKLSVIAGHNFKVLKATNIVVVNAEGIEYLTKNTQKYDWIYVDPSRRHDIKGKVYYLKDCIPNIPEHLDKLFKHSNNILIKASPMLDISMGITELRCVKEVHIVATNNEVKELLFVLEHGNNDAVLVKTVNFQKESIQKFNFVLEEEKETNASFSEVQKYVYEPNSAILKSGAFKSISKKLKLSKLHKNTHLYTSSTLVAFPGRIFCVDQIVSYHKKKVRSLIQRKKMNVATRNFPESVAQLKKRFGFKDGGDTYVFFTTNCNDEKMVLFCKKI